MNATWYDVAIWLNANGYGTLAADLFGGQWGEPDQQVLVLDGIGTPSGLPTLYEQPSIQILSRGAKSEAPNVVYQRLKVISDALLNSPERVDMNGTEYAGFEQGSNIAPLGLDDNQRHIYSANFYTYRCGSHQT